MAKLSDGWTVHDVEQLLARQVPVELREVAIAISLSPPDPAQCPSPDWAEAICAKLAEHPDVEVAQNAILAFGHLARTLGQLDEARVRPLVERALRSDEPGLRGQAEAAADDLEHFLGWTFPDIDAPH